MTNKVMQEFVSLIKSTNRQLLQKYKGTSGLVAIFPLMFFEDFFARCAMLDVMPIPFEKWKELFPKDYEELLQLLQNQKKEVKK